MKLLNKKGYISSAPIYILFTIVFVIFTFNSWRNMPNHNEINFFPVLSKYNFWLFICIVLLCAISFIVEFIYDSIHTHKIWLKFYEGKVSETTIKSLMDEVDNYNLIKDRALEIYKENNGSYLFSYMISSQEFHKIDDDNYAKEILENFQKEIPSLINKIKEIEYVAFEENNYSVLKRLSFSFIFININENNSISYDYDENIKEVINSRIMNDIIENNSKEDILAYIVLYLFYGNYSLF